MKRDTVTVSPNGARRQDREFNGHTYTLREHYRQLTIDGSEDVVWSILKDGRLITAEKEAARIKLRVFGKGS